MNKKDIDNLTHQNTVAAPGNKDTLTPTDPKKGVTQRDDITEHITVIPPTTRKPKTHKLTGKQKAFVHELINNPTSTATDAFKKVYKPKTTNRQVIHNYASGVRNNKAVVSELAKYSGMYEEVINNTISEWGYEDNTRKREIATTLAMYAHDKVHGKATQRIMTDSKVVSININLTGDNELPPEDL